MGGLVYERIDVPFGFCHCGCNERTSLATQNNKRAGHVKGQPMRFIRGHVNRLPKSMPPQIGMKLCSICKEPKPIEDFRKRKHSVDGRAYECRSCMQEYMAQRWKIIRVPELDKRKEQYKSRKQRLLLHAEYLRFRRYGVSREWYEEKIESQSFRCAMCGSAETKCNGKRFHIDHYHGCCGKKLACDKCRRGLLCNSCNLRLGVLENREFIEAAKIYLSSYGMTLTL